MIRNAAWLESISSTPARFQTAEEYVYVSLRDLILSARIPGGQRLNQDEIAQRLKVSRMPVRQAFLRLESDGLIVNRPNRGAIVTQLSPSAILELFEMRSVLEGLAASLAVGRMDEKALDELRARVDELKRVEHNTSLWITRHDEFHSFICSFADRPALAANIWHLRQRVAPLIRVYLSSHEGAEMTGFEHHNLVDAFDRGDAAEVERTMREHAMSAAQGVLDFVTHFEPGTHAEVGTQE